MRFEVACAATVGTLEITTTSTGTPSDPDGYQLQLDGGTVRPIAVGATVSIPGVAPGSHTVALGDLAANCAVDGDNPRTVTVAAGATTSATIAVACTTPTPPPAPGGISVTTQTSGPDADADGYTVSLDGTGALPIGSRRHPAAARPGAGDAHRGAQRPQRELPAGAATTRGA